MFVNPIQLRSNVPFGLSRPHCVREALCQAIVSMVFFDRPTDAPQHGRMLTFRPRHLSMTYLGATLALGLAAMSCDDTAREAPTDTDSATNPDDHDADTSPATEPGAPSLEPSDYPAPGTPTPGAVGPCSFDQNRLTACELTIEGPGLFALESPTSPPDDLEGDPDLFSRRLLVSWRPDLGLVSTSGEVLLGYPVGPDGALLPGLGELSTPYLHPPRATSEVWLSLNLDAGGPIEPGGFDINVPSLTSSHTTIVTVYDTLGAAHQLELYFTRTAPNEWQWSAIAPEDAIEGNGSTSPTRLVSGILSFDGHGLLVGANADTSTVAFFPGAPQELAFYFHENPSIEPPSSGTTQFAAYDQNFNTWQDGYPAGEAALLEVGSDGWLCVAWSNGAQACPGRLAVALFESPTRLFEHGPGLWVPTEASGAPQPGPALFGGRGGIVGAIVPPAR